VPPIPFLEGCCELQCIGFKNKQEREKSVSLPLKVAVYTVLCIGFEVRTVLRKDELLSSYFCPPVLKDDVLYCAVP
jgi:hypothetical protein